MKSSMPLVTIGIPTYGRLGGLKDALRCIRDQTYSNLEIIVSDNCTPGDDVDRYMHQVMQEDSRVRYFKQSHNIGAVANFEFTLNIAQGKYFAWAADDDLCEVRFVEDIMQQMVKDSSIVLGFCDVSIIDEHSDIVGVEHLDSIRSESNWSRARALFFRLTTPGIFFCVYGIYQTDILKMCDLRLSKGWKGYVTHAEVPFLAQVSSFGRIVAVPKANKLWRRQPNSLYHDEIKGINRFDYVMLRLVIRARLFKMALIDSAGISTRFVLLKAVVTSFFGSELKIIVSCLLPKEIKQYVKRKLMS